MENLIAGLATNQLDVQKLQELLIALGLGGAVGVATGAAIKYTARRVLIAIGIVIIFLQISQYVGFIDVRWDKVTESALPLFDANEDGVLNEEDVKYMMENVAKIAPEILTQGLPNLTGFASGLFVAFWFL